jgi:hypothetical protein
LNTKAALPDDLDGEVAALLRRFYTLQYGKQLAAAVEIARCLQPEAVVPGLGSAAAEQQEGLAVLEAAVTQLELPAGVAPTARAFNGTEAARAAGWNSTRVARVFGRWNFALDRLRGKPQRQSAAQRAAERAARRGVHREREDYLRGLRLWLASEPPSFTTCDYDAWRNEYNEKLADGELPLVSYSMLRKAFRSSWADLIEVARGNLSIAEAEAHTRPSPLARVEGSHGLIGFAEVRELLGLSITAARAATRRPGFPPPAYTHLRGPRQRLWRRGEVEAFIAGDSTAESASLQHEYLDAHQVAEALGLAVITVTTGSSPRVPAPSVRAAGLQLWQCKDVDLASQSENSNPSRPVLAASVDGRHNKSQTHDPRPPLPTAGGRGG